MNLPNKISIFRVILIPAFMLFIIPLPDFAFLQGFNEWVAQYGRIVAGIVYIIASVSDSVDGYLARSKNLVTDFGKFIDPIADKLLVTSAVLALIQAGQLSSWAAFLIIGRELLVTGFRMVCSGKGKVIAANKYGKLKMISQTVAIIWLIFEPLFEQYYFWEVNVTPGDVLMFIAVVLTVVSGYVYIRDNINLLSKEY